MTTIIKGFGGSDDKKKYLYNIYTVSTSQSGANIQIRKFLIDKNMELVTLVDTPGVYQSGNIMYDDEILKITYGNIYTFNWSYTQNRLLYCLLDSCLQNIQINYFIIGTIVLVLISG